MNEITFQTVASTEFSDSEGNRFTLRWRRHAPIRGLAGGDAIDCVAETCGQTLFDYRAIPILQAEQIYQKSLLKLEKSLGLVICQGRC